MSLHASASGKPRRLSSIRLTVTPRRVIAGRKTRFAFRASAVVVGRREWVRGARISFAGVRLSTDKGGRARVTARLRRTGRRVARATAPSLRSGRATVRVVRGR